MDQDEYKLQAMLLHRIPPDSVTPPGQKFHIGEIVRISNPVNWYSKEYTKPQDLFEIQFSYFQKYGGNDENDGGRSKRNYCLRRLYDNRTTSWFYESELELVKGIQEITDERDWIEYQRLCEKFKDKNEQPNQLK